MKNNKLFKLENKYYYGFSRTFWHILIAMASIGIIVSIAVIAYTYFPTSKEDVSKQIPPSKEEYPPQAEVTLNELLTSLPKEEIQKIEVKKEEIEETPIIDTKDIEPKQDTLGLAEFERQFSRLKNLISPTKYKSFWEGEGEYIYTDRVRYNITKSEEYRKWVSKSEAFKVRLIKTTTSKGFSSYPQKTKLINQYYNVLNAVSEDSRVSIAYELIQFEVQNTDKTLSSLESLSKILNLYDEKDKVLGFNTNQQFLQRNPNDGIGMLNFEIEILPQFSKSQRYLVSRTIKEEYRNFYNNNIPGLSENTLNFTKYLSNLKPEQQALALGKYYQLYRSKNANRVQQIQDIENRYAQQLAQIEAEYQAALLAAEANYAAKLVGKGALRKTSYIGVGIALGAVLLITVILLLLSMVRNVNKLALAMLENTNEMKKINQDQ